MNLNMYTEVPGGNCSFSQLENFCKERFILYHILEEAKFLNLDEGTLIWAEFLKDKLKTAQLKSYCCLIECDFNEELVEKRKEDNIAHWIVGLCYCETKELQNYFVNWELQWFHLLFISSDKFQREHILKKQNLMCKEVEKLVCFINNENYINSTDVDEMDINSTFYTAKFCEVPGVVGKRAALLNDGMAIFSEKHLIEYVKNKLKKEFIKCLEHQSQAIVYLGGNISDLLKNMNKFLPTISHITDIEINLENIDGVAETHFPLCMRHLHTLLRTNHHLKYDAKMQYGIFLYWLGMSYKDALQFWKSEFTKKMPEVYFDKKYSYLFKHQYGEVGRKSPYNESSCKDILGISLKSINCHGCPFKHWSKTLLLNYIKNDTCCLKDIEDLVDQNEYQKACTMYLYSSKLTQNKGGDFIKTPKQYVIDSINCVDVLDEVFVDINEVH